MLFNEPKLLKSKQLRQPYRDLAGFSALQRAEIAEIVLQIVLRPQPVGFSALQRAEIAEMDDVPTRTENGARFSALQRAEIAEMR